jgi:hypothetical protein
MKRLAGMELVLLDPYLVLVPWLGLVPWLILPKHTPTTEAPTGSVGERDSH